MGNLSKQVTGAQLIELATPYGKIVSAHVATERGNGDSKGFGFIESSNECWDIEDARTTFVPELGR